MSKERIEIHDSVESFIKFCDNQPNKTWEGKSRSSNQKGNTGWYGNVSYDGAKALALNGWDKGLKDISERMAQITKECHGKVTLKSIAGSHPDVARFIAGMPDCMNRRIYSDAAKKPCLDIVLNQSYSASVKSSDIMNYGAAIASFIDQLENSGYSISLSIAAVSTTYGTYINNGFLLHLKNQGEALDIGKLVYFIAHTSMLRRLGFAHWEVQCNYDELAGGYGCIVDLPKHMQGDLYFGKEGNLSQCNTIDSALEYVKQQVTKQMPDLLDGIQEAA